MFLVDLQGFQAVDKSFIAKEVAVCTLHGGQVAHFILEPPTNTFPDPKTKEYLELYHHGLDWYRGFMPYENLKKALEDIIGEKDAVLCKGLEKCKFLNTLLKNKVTNIDSWEMPNLASYKKFQIKCLYHNSDYMHCALKNVKFLRDYILLHMEFSELYLMV